MLNIGPEKLIVVLAVALIVLGPQEAPRIAQELGRWLRVLRELQSRVQSEVTRFTDTIVADEPAASETTAERSAASRDETPNGEAR